VTIKQHYSLRKLLLNLLLKKIKYGTKYYLSKGQTVLHDSRVSDPDPDSIRSVDPDPDSKSRSRRAKMTHKSRNKFRNLMF
jgi:hypothetical protein